MDIGSPLSQCLSLSLAGILFLNPLMGAAAQLSVDRSVGNNTQVTGGQRSTLLGYTEVAGDSARVIVANPHGITCNGCGFINTPRVTLSTGQPVVEQGRLSRFKMEGLRRTGGVMIAARSV